jgi:hypothetical protein
MNAPWTISTNAKFLRLRKKKDSRSVPSEKGTVFDEHICSKISGCPSVLNSGKPIRRMHPELASSLSKIQLQ